MEVKLGSFSFAFVIIFISSLRQNSTAQQRFHFNVQSKGFRSAIEWKQLESNENLQYEKQHLKDNYREKSFELVLLVQTAKYYTNMYSLTSSWLNFLSFWIILEHWWKCRIHTWVLWSRPTLLYRNTRWLSRRRLRFKPCSVSKVSSSLRRSNWLVSSSLRRTLWLVASSLRRKLWLVSSSLRRRLWLVIRVCWRLTFSRRELMMDEFLSNSKENACARLSPWRWQFSLKACVLRQDPPWGCFSHLWS